MRKPKMKASLSVTYHYSHGALGDSDYWQAVLSFGAFTYRCRSNKSPFDAIGRVLHNHLDKFGIKFDADPLKLFCF